jgi:hypothetical protein
MPSPESPAKRTITWDSCSTGLATAHRYSGRNHGRSLNGRLPAEEAKGDEAQHEGDPEEHRQIGGHRRLAGNYEASASSASRSTGCVNIVGLPSASSGHSSRGLS